MNIETKKQIDAIRHKYASAGDIIFKSAILYLFEYGVVNAQWEDPNEAVAEHPELFYVKGIYECAIEISYISGVSLLEYIQTADLFYNGNTIPYQRLSQIAATFLSRIDMDNADRSTTYETLSGFLTDREIKMLGGEYILDAVKEELDNE